MIQNNMAAVQPYILYNTYVNIYIYLCKGCYIVTHISYVSKGSTMNHVSDTFVGDRNSLGRGLFFTLHNFYTNKKMLLNTVM